MKEIQVYSVRIVQDGQFKNKRLEVPVDVYNYKKTNAKHDPDFFTWECNEIPYTKLVADSYNSFTEVTQTAMDINKFLVEEPTESPVESPVVTSDSVEVQRFNELKEIGFVRLNATQKEEYKTLKAKLGA